jgi:hypothetical protein
MKSTPANREKAMNKSKWLFGIHCTGELLPAGAEMRRPAAVPQGKMR